MFDRCIELHTYVVLNSAAKQNATSAPFLYNSSQLAVWRDELCITSIQSNLDRRVSLFLQQHSAIGKRHATPSRRLRPLVCVDHVCYWVLSELFCGAVLANLVCGSVGKEKTALVSRADRQCRSLV